MGKALKTATVVLALSFNLSQDSDAEILLEFTEADGDVILYVSGTLDLTGLTESNRGASLGGATLLDTVNEQFQLGSGVAAPVNAFTLTVQNEVFSSTTDLFGTIDSWEANTNSIRFQQNNGQVLMDDEIEAGDVIEVTSTHTFSGLSFADFGLTQGDNIVWLENTNVDGDAGQVIVTAGLRDTGPSAPSCNYRDRLLARSEPRGDPDLEQDRCRGLHRQILVRHDRLGRGLGRRHHRGTRREPR